MSVGLLIVFLGVVVLGRTIWGGAGKTLSNKIIGASDAGEPADDPGGMLDGLGGAIEELEQSFPTPAPAVESTPRSRRAPGTRGRATRHVWGDATTRGLGRA